MKRSTKERASKGKTPEEKEIEKIELDLEELYTLGIKQSEKRLEGKEDFDLELLEMFTGYQEAHNLQYLLDSKPKVVYYKQEGYEFYTIEAIGSPVYWLFYDRSFCSCGAERKCCHIYFLDICLQRKQGIQTGFMDQNTFILGLFNALN